MEFLLSDKERATFDSEGWTGPFRAIDPSEGPTLVPDYKEWWENSEKQPFPATPSGESVLRDKPWYQGMHAEIRRIYEIASSPPVLDRVRGILGDDVLLWAASFFGQAPQQTIHWHADLEYQVVDGVSVWLALENVTPANTLRLMAGSQRFTETPETLMPARKLNLLDFQNDDYVLNLAHEFDADARIVQQPLDPGEFILFRGRMWHGSFNPEPVYRSALNFRFTTPDQKAPITRNFLWPPDIDPVQPPCILLSGEDRAGVNRLVEPPPAE
jgi:hypothetical protein